MDKKEQQKKEAASRKEENMEAVLDMILTIAYYSLYHPERVLRRLDEDGGELIVFPKTIHYKPQ